MYTSLHHLHSFLRYPILLVLIITISVSFISYRKSDAYAKKHHLLSLFSMILVHLQLVIGLILYSISPKVLLKDIGSTMKDPLFRFFAVEHLIGMLIAIIIITIGRSKSKKINEDIKKHKIIFVYYLIGLVIIFMSIPWPFLKSFGSWF